MIKPSTEASSGTKDTSAAHNKLGSIEMVSIDFSDESGTGIIEYGNRLFRSIKKLKKHKVSTHEVIPGIKLKNNVHVRFSFSWIKKLFEHKILARETPSVVHYMDPAFIALDPIRSNPFAKEKPKMVVTIHDFYMYRPLTFKPFFKYYSAPLILANKLLHTTMWLFAYMWRRYSTALAVKVAHKLICVSEITKKELVKSFNVAEDKCVVIYPIISSKIFRPVKKYRSKEKIVIGHMSSYNFHKNVGTLINAFKKTKNPNLELHLYGGPSPFPFDISDDPRIKHIEFMPTEKLPEMYNSFDVFVFPSLWEGFGMPIMEAKACKVPVITYAKGELPEIVKNNTLQFENERQLTKMLETQAWKKIDVKKAYADKEKCGERFVAKQLIKAYSS